MNNNEQKNIWNKLYSRWNEVKPIRADWLEKHDKILLSSKDDTIIDLGCGIGSNSIYLYEKGIDVIACDISEEALKMLKRYLPNANIMCFDILRGLPFNNNYTKVLVADLSLHYFSLKNTKIVIKEIKRVLKNEGYLLCRVNSTKEKKMKYDTNKIVEIQKNYYNIKGKVMRFFDKEQVEELFEEFDITYINEEKIPWYNKRNKHTVVEDSKVVWEIVVKKKKNV